MLRLFIAIVPPLVVRERLAHLREQLRVLGADAKWVETENIHLTMRFLGEVESARASHISRALAEAASRHSAFPVRVQGSGVFPNRRRPRVVWVGLEGDLDALRALQVDIEAGLVPLGFAPEARGFSPHVTLGRLRSETGARALVERLDALRGEVYGQFTVDRVVLMESKLSSRGPTYHHVHDAALGPVKI